MIYFDFAEFAMTWHGFARFDMIWHGFAKFDMFCRDFVQIDNILTWFCNLTWPDMILQTWTRFGMILLILIRFALIQVPYCVHLSSFQSWLRWAQLLRDHVHWCYQLRTLDAFSTRGIVFVHLHVWVLLLAIGVTVMMFGDRLQHFVHLPWFFFCYLKSKPILFAEPISNILHDVFAEREPIIFSFLSSFAGPSKHVSFSMLLIL